MEEIKKKLKDYLYKMKAEDKAYQLVPTLIAGQGNVHPDKCDCHIGEHQNKREQRKHHLTLEQNLLHFVLFFIF